MKGKCAKQETIAIIENHGQYWVGTNWCYKPQAECPRKDLPSGEGYDLCYLVCNQSAHAEVNACMKAGNNAIGGTLYLLGHTYCCESCQRTMKNFGIKKVVIGELPEGWKCSLT